MEPRDMMSKVTLPALVRATANLGRGDEVLIKEGEVIVLHSLQDVPRIRALGNINEEFFFPLTCKQKFERLPTDPRLDDKVFVSVHQVLRSHPLPTLVRCLESFYHDDEVSAVYAGDVIEVSGVETDDEDRYLVGVNQEHVTLRLSERHCTAHFTTMPNVDFVTMSYLAKLKFPQRVRIPDETNKKSVSDLKVLNLLELQWQQHVIATCAHNIERIFSIPNHLPYRFEVVHDANLNLQTTLAALVALYKNLNLTLPNVTVVGMPVLPPEWTGTPQPLSEVLREWEKSYEGHLFSRSVADTDAQEGEEERKELKTTIQVLQYELNRAHQGNFLCAQCRAGQVSTPSPPRRSKASANSSSTLGRSATMDPSANSTYARSNGEKAPQKKSQGLEKQLHDKDKECRELKSELQQANIYRDRCRILEKMKDDQVKRIKDLEHDMDQLLYNNQSAASTPLNGSLRTGTGSYSSTPPKYPSPDAMSISSTQTSSPVRASSSESMPSHSSTLDSKLLHDAACEVLYPGRDADTITKVRMMTVDDVVALLHKIKLENYEEAFRQEDVDGDLLLSLDEDVLMSDLGMKRIHAIKLLKKMGKV